MSNNIALIGMPNVKNYGDPILFRSAEYLIKEAVPESTIIELDLNGFDPSVYKNLASKTLTLFALVFSKLGLKNSKLVYNLQFNATKIRHNSYYERILSLVDTAVFAGGGIIKYKYENLGEKISAIVKIAEEKGIDVKFHSVGIEDYSETNIKCQELKKSLNSDCVSAISTRDDFGTLKDFYIDNSNIKLASVVDSAFWVNRAYHSSLTEKSEDIIVGLGIARSNIFVDNGISFDEQDQINFWVNLVETLDKSQLKWEFYTNGAQADIDFLNTLLKTSFFEKYEKKIITNIPDSDVDLVNIINRFSKVFSIRMHASIVAYSLEIPSFGLIWNDKVKMFSKIINHENRYFSPHDINFQEVVSEIIDSEFTEKDRLTRDGERLKTSEFILSQFK